MTAPEPDGEGAQGASGAPVAMALTAAAAAAAFPVLPFAPYVALYAFGIAWLHAAFIALPIYLALSRTRRLTEGASIGGGCLVGAVPALLVATGILLLRKPAANGAAWADGLVLAVVFGFLGMLGGAAFWAVMRRHAAPRRPGPFDPFA